MYNFERFEKMLLLIDSCNKKGKKQQQKHRISLKSFQESGHCWF